MSNDNETVFLSRIIFIPYKTIKYNNYNENKKASKMIAQIIGYTGIIT